MLVALVQRGQLQAELAAAPHEIGAELLVLGHPGVREAIFYETAIRTLASRLEREAGAEDHLVPPQNT